MLPRFVSGPTGGVQEPATAPVAQAPAADQSRAGERTVAERTLQQLLQLQARLELG
ncbi:MAG: hypothetical protein GWP20_01875, partial [Thermotogales bacterium]|nr:hypothetical protein [Thermotogales bacterium]